MNKQIYEEASEWLIELRVGDIDAVARGRLDSWFRESPHHIRAFLELSSIWEDGSDPDLDRDHSTDALIAKARAATNVIPLEKAGREARRSPEKPAPKPRRVSALTALARVFSWRPVVLASIAVACVGVGLLVLQSVLNPIYATDTGEQRTVRLRDGSQVTLNSHSRIRVRFSSHERDIDLLEGQVLCRVARDPSRPFVVRSDSIRVRAVGTQFDVYRKPSGTVVTVVEGRVVVLPPPTDITAVPSAAPPRKDSNPDALGTILVSAGEQVTVTTSTVTPPTHADVVAATAWTQQEIVFDLTSLPDVVQEFNRYNVRKLVVSDARLNDFHITGVFSSTDPASLLRFLLAQPGITVEETDTEIRILKK
jgi:transmembrane sensor